MAVRATTYDGPEQVFQECTVERWRGYTRSSFVACLADGSLVAESGAFKCKGDVPAEGAALEAHAALLRQLEALGWEQSAHGEAWYAVRYGRWVDAPEVEEPELDEPEVTAPAPAPEPAAPVVRAVPTPAPPPPQPKPEPVVVAPPPPAPAAAPQPAPAPAPAPARAPVASRSRAVRIAWFILLCAIGVATAVALGLFIVGHRSHVTTRVTTVVVTTTAPAVTATSAAVPAPAPAPAAPKPRLVHVTIVAPTRASWFEIRRGSATGPVLFSGELQPGHTLRVSGVRLWSRFGAAGNLEITENGRRVPLLGTFEHVFRAPR